MRSATAAANFAAFPGRMLEPLKHLAYVTTHLFIDKVIRIRSLPGDPRNNLQKNPRLDIVWLQML